MTITPSQFVVNFPEFADGAKFPTPAVQAGLDYAYLILDPDRFGTFLDPAAQLLAAHVLILETQAMAAVARGALPGVSYGVLTSKSLGPASVGYDVTSATRPGDADYNLTVYGIRFSRLNRIAGMAPVMAGVGPDSWPGQVA